MSEPVPEAMVEKMDDLMGEIENFVTRPADHVDPLSEEEMRLFKSASVRAEIGLTDDGSMPERPVYPTYPTRDLSRT